MISVYKIDINEIENEAYEKEYSLISSVEKNRLDSFKNYEDKKRSLAGKILLRKGIAELYGIKDFTVTKSENGKPLLPFCFFIISHSNNLAVCAISDSPVGIDIEFKRIIKKRDNYHCFTDEEIGFVNSSEDYMERFLQIWTRKEAYLKCFDVTTSVLAEISLIDGGQGFKLTTEKHSDYTYSVCLATNDF